MKRMSFTIALIALLGTSAPGVAQQGAQQGGGHFEKGVWIPEGNTLAEVEQQQAANKAQAESAKQVTIQNQARLAAFDKAQAAYQAELAEVEAKKKAIDAEAARVAAEHEAAMAKWREDVAACKDGDKKRCAPVEKD